MRYIPVQPRAGALRRRHRRIIHEREYGRGYIAVRRPACRRAGRLPNRSVRPRRADVSASRLDALAGGVARPHDPAGPHRLYRPGEADRSRVASQGRSRTLSRYSRVRTGRSLAIGPHSLSGFQPARRGCGTLNDALRPWRRLHARAVGGYRLYHQQDRFGKRNGGDQRELPPCARVAVSGLPR